MNHKVELYVLIPPIYKLLQLSLYTSLRTGVCGIESRSTGAFEGVAVAVAQPSIGMFRSVGQCAIGPVAPIYKGGPIDTSLLSILATIANKSGMVAYIEVVPVRVEADIYYVIFGVETYTLQAVGKEVRYIYGLFAGDFFLYHTPTVPTHRFGPGKGQSEVYGSTKVGICLHTTSPIGKVTNHNFR